VKDVGEGIRVGHRRKRESRFEDHLNKAAVVVCRDRELMNLFEPNSDILNDVY
jgi:hypothetical protein